MIILTIIYWFRYTARFLSLCTIEQQQLKSNNKKRCPTTTAHRILKSGQCVIVCNAMQQWMVCMLAVKFQMVPNEMKKKWFTIDCAVFVCVCVWMDICAVLCKSKSKTISWTQVKNQGLMYDHGNTLRSAWSVQHTIVYTNGYNLKSCVATLHRCNRLFQTWKSRKWKWKRWRAVCWNLFKLLETGYWENMIWLSLSFAILRYNPWLRCCLYFDWSLNAFDRNRLDRFNRNCKSQKPMTVENGGSIKMCTKDNHKISSAIRLIHHLRL